MAQKKASGSSKNGRDSRSNRHGVKKFGGQSAIPGNILIRQMGSKFYPGKGTKIGRDFTIFAVEEGRVSFSETKTRSFVHVTKE